MSELIHPLLIPAPTGSTRHPPSFAALHPARVPDWITEHLGPDPCPHETSSGALIWTPRHPATSDLLNFDATDLLGAMGADEACPVYGPAIVTGVDHDGLTDPPPLAVAFIEIMIHPEHPEQGNERP